MIPIPIKSQVRNPQWLKLESMGKLTGKKAQICIVSVEVYIFLYINLLMLFPCIKIPLVDPPPPPFDLSVGVPIFFIILIVCMLS